MKWHMQVFPSDPQFSMFECMQKIIAEETQHVVDATIKHRKTEKVLADAPLPSKPDGPIDETLKELLQLAAYAPFHKKCDDIHRQETLDAGVPWRIYTLNTANCRHLRAYIDSIQLQTGKIASMLGTADALLIATWLPDPEEGVDFGGEDEPIPFKGDIKNMEHVAAASAAIQNILIGATARKIPNYWSSGGHLRSQILREYLQIPMREILLGAIFLFPEDSKELPVDIKTGKLRDEGKDISTWSRSITWSDERTNHD